MVQHASVKCGSRWVLFGLLAASMASCGVLLEPAYEAHRRWEWSYPTPVQASSPPLVPERLWVQELVDARPDVTDFRRLIALIPLVPYATSTFDRPDHGTPGVIEPAFAPVADITKAIVDELSAARIFAGVVRAPDRGAEWQLGGQLRSTRSTHHDITYGLSLFAAAPWMLGLPSEVTDNELVLHLTLRRSPSSPLVWTYDLRAADSDWYNVYSGSIDYRYDALLREAMPSVLASLREALQAAANGRS